MAVKTKVFALKKTLSEFEAYSHLPGLLVNVKDLQSRFIAYSPQLAKMVGWEKPDMAIGKTDHNLPCDVAKFADVFIQQDRQVIDSKKPMITLNIQEYTTGWKLVLGDKKPIFDSFGKVCAILSHHTDVSEIESFYRMVGLTDFDQKKFDPEKLKPKSYILTDSHCPLPLTDKQACCMFYLVRGKNYKEIANLLNLSHRTVESYMDIVKSKLFCASKSELIEKALVKGFLFYIPKALRVAGI